MKYSIKPKNDSDKENAKQLELIMNHKLATYDDISEVINEIVDNFGFDDHRGISIKSINPMNMHAVMMTSVIGGLNHNIMIADDIEIKEPELILFQEQKQQKENHPHGWYRKFDKKRF